jgi:acetoin utilization deacetylase AcuC-like enzyme
MRLASAMALLVVSSKALRGVGGFRTGAALPSLGDRDQRPKGSRRGYVTATTSPHPPFIHYYYNDCFHVQMPEGHRFPMEKYRAFRNQAQQRLHPLPHITFHPSPLVSLQDLETTHERQYIQRYLTGRVTDQEKRESGFPWNRQHVNRTLSSVGGTVAAMHSIFRHADNTAAAGPQVGAHCAGGTHHAFRAKMEGFCIFSDIAVAANVALRDYPHAVGRILIVDLDVHQGKSGGLKFFFSLEGKSKKKTADLNNTLLYLSTHTTRQW